MPGCIVSFACVISSCSYILEPPRTSCRSKKACAMPPHGRMSSDSAGRVVHSCTIWIYGWETLQSVSNGQGSLWDDSWLGATHTPKKPTQQLPFQTRQVAQVHSSAGDNPPRQVLRRGGQFQKREVNTKNNIWGEVYDIMSISAPDATLSCRVTPAQLALCTRVRCGVRRLHNSPALVKENPRKIRAGYYFSPPTRSRHFLLDNWLQEEYKNQPQGAASRVALKRIVTISILGRYRISYQNSIFGIALRRTNTKRRGIVRRIT